MFCYNASSSNHATLSFFSLWGLLAGGGAVPPVPPVASGGDIAVANLLGPVLLAGSTNGAKLLFVGHGEKVPGLEAG